MERVAKLFMPTSINPLVYPPPIAWAEVANAKKTE